MILFTKTYPRDYPWLEVAIRSVKHFAREGITWFIVVDDWSPEQSEWQKWAGEMIDVRVVRVQDHWPEVAAIAGGYMQQQWIKMNAHRVINEQTAWNWDSDVRAIRIFDAQTFKQDSIPVIWRSDYNDLIPHGYPRCRRDFINSLFGGPCQWEWMRCMPIVLHGELLAQASESTIWSESLRRLNDSNSSNNCFSEFLIIGEYMHRHFREFFVFKTCETEGPTWAGPESNPVAVCDQSWSWGGVSKEIQAWARKL